MMVDCSCAGSLAFEERVEEKEGFLRDGIALRRRGCFFYNVGSLYNYLSIKFYETSLIQLLRFTV